MPDQGNPFRFGGLTLTVPRWVDLFQDIHGRDWKAPFERWVQKVTSKPEGRNGRAK